tara:strand:+ start:1198 stop:1980 length:783 start_codon:yes stop_codon:yes gene_type:complete
MGYFNVTAKPFILPSEQHDGNITDTQILADWTSFEIPKGAARLIGMTVLYRGKNGADVTPTDFEIIWAKSNPDGSAPTSLGAVTAAVGAPAEGSPPWFNLVQSRSYIDVTNGGNDGDLTYMNVIVPQSIGGRVADTYLNGGVGNTIVLQGEPNSGTNVGFDKLYCALIAKATHNWGASTITVNGTPATTTNVIAVADVDAGLVFAPGDVIYDEDDRLMGTVKSIDSDVQITFENNLANAGVNDKVLYNGSPITLVLSFEQ